MSHRIVSRRDDGVLTLEFEGVLDRAALVELRAALVAEAAPLRARILLRAGTAVDRELVAALVALGVPVAAESPYLARWLADAGPHTRSRR